jgi:hypothetical protein
VSAQVPSALGQLAEDLLPLVVCHA